MTSRELIWVVLALAAVVALGLAGLAAWRRSREKRRRELARRLGPEYDRLLREHGSAARVERELAERRARVRKLSLRELSEAERSSFGEAWRQAQERFVDTPLIAVRSAHDVVQQVMRARGYPVQDFERTVADLSVDHAEVVQHYRAAHALHEQGHLSTEHTEELRQAMVHYRALFAALLGTAPERQPSSSRMSPAHA